LVELPADPARALDAATMGSAMATKAWRQGYIRRQNAQGDPATCDTIATLCLLQRLFDYGECDAALPGPPPRDADIPILGTSITCTA
jgi:hypothetical protein